MATRARGARKIPGPAKAAATLASLWALALWGLPLIVQLFHTLNRLAFGDHLGQWVQRTVTDAINTTCRIVGYHVLPSALLFVSIAIPLGVLARILARARVRASLPDPLERLRDLACRRPSLARLITTVPALVALGAFLRHSCASVLDYGGTSMFGEYAGSPVVRSMHTVYNLGMTGFAVLGAITALGAFELTRVGVRALLAPTLPPEPTYSSASDDRIAFDAVTVTLETRAAVLAMGLLPFAVAGLVALVSPLLPRLDVAPSAIALYVTLAIAGTLGFRRASRIVVGLDGVLVTGSSPTRFYAYRDLESAESRSAEIRLRTRAGKVVRLQPHSEDAARRETILARIQSGIESARDGAHAAAGSVVACSSPAELARIADAAADYRAPALTREQLWGVVEGPEHAVATRAAAAEALARTGAHDARARLERIAEHTAEPRVRVALARLATEMGPVTRTEEPEEEEDEWAGPRSLGA
jgi:hypothetical protein